MESILPSEIARLVYGYLEEDGCKTAAKTFLETSSHMKECVSIASKGRKFTTKFQGLNLVELLDLICELCCYVRSVECEMKTREVPVAEVLHQFAKILRLVNDESSTSKPLYLRFTVPNSPKKGRKTKPSKSSSSLSKSSTERSPTPAKSPTPAVDENPESPDDAHPNEILFQCLLENKALHEKLAENINQVVATKCDSEPLDKILEKKIVETIINTTEQDPIFQEMIEELVGPIDSTPNSYDPKMPQDQSADLEASAAVNPGIPPEDARYGLKSPSTPETPRAPSCRNSFPGFSPPALQLSKPLGVLSVAPVVAVPALPVAQSSPQNQQLLQPPFHGTIVTGYPGAINTPTALTGGTTGNWQTYTYTTNKGQIASSAMQSTIGSISLLPAVGTSSYRPIAQKPSTSTIKIYNPAVSGQTLEDSCLENLLKQPLTSMVQNVRPKLPSKLPTPQPVVDRSLVKPMRTGGVRTRGGSRDAQKVYGASKRAKVLYSVTSACQNKEKDESGAPADEPATPMYKIVVTPLGPSQKQDGEKEAASVTSSDTATLHAFDPVPTAAEQTILPSIVVSQAEPSITGTTTSSTENQTASNPTPTGGLASPKSSTAETNGLLTSSAKPPVECSPATTVSSGVVSSSSTCVSAASNAETVTTSLPAVPDTAASSSGLISSLVNATPQQGSGLKKNLRKRVSLSTPRKGSHVRTLEFATPPKSAKGSKKSFSSPKHKTPATMPNKALENVKSVLFKSPQKKKKAWDADLRVVFSAVNDIPTSVGLKRKITADEDQSPKPTADEVKIIENDVEDDVCRTREEIVSRIQKDVLDVIGEENIGELSRISFGTNKSPDILNLTSAEAKTPAKSPGSSSILDIGDTGIPQSTIKRLYPKNEIHRDENSTSDSPLTLKASNSPQKRLLDTVTSKLFGTPPRTGSPCTSLPATPSSVSLEAALIRECARIESQNLAERPFKDIALTSLKPSAGENDFGNPLLPPPKGTMVFKTPAKSSLAVPVEMTPVSKIIHEETRVNQCLLLTPTIPPTPDTDQMKSADAPQKPEELTTPPDVSKQNGPVEPADQIVSAPSRPAKTPSKTPQVRLRAKTKPRDPGKITARKRGKKAEEGNEFAKLVDECFKRATGAVFGPSEGQITPPSPEQPVNRRNRKPPSKKLPMKKNSGSQLTSKESPDGFKSAFEKILNKHESASIVSESGDEDLEMVPKKVATKQRKTKGKRQKSAEAVVKSSEEPSTEKSADQRRQKRKTRKKSPAAAVEEVKLSNEQAASKTDAGCTLAADPEPSKTEDDSGRASVSKSSSSAAHSGDAVRLLDLPSAVEERAASEAPLEVSSIRSPSPVTPEPCLDRLDNYQVGYENHDGRLVCLRLSPFLDFFELPRDISASRSSRAQRRLPKLSSQSSHQVVNVHREQYSKRHRRSSSVSSYASDDGRDSPSKNKRKKRRMIDSKHDYNHSRHDWNRSAAGTDQVFSGRPLRDSIKPTLKYRHKSSYLQDRRYGRYSPGRYVPPKNRHNKFDRFSHHKDRPSRWPRDRVNDSSNIRDRSNDRSKNRSTSHGSQSTSSSKKSSSAISPKDLISKIESPVARPSDTSRDHRSSNSFSGIGASAAMIAPPPIRRPPRSRLDDELEEGELSDTSRSTVFSSCRKPDATTKIFPARLNSPVDDESRQALLQQVDLDKFLSLVHSQDKK
ncbi:Hypothetical protein NTJ_08800 [Nesidiocoris tenuis]|uniref:LisH domain-containing protein n=1 Tax=Nesidiocoris tenuis TaxID=355587 RepID=A0ABN7AUY3_9HEMI|nr:Hypothetical protein NTJ_08800 [Nesidiocoris tenuis]